METHVCPLHGNITSDVKKKKGGGGQGVASPTFLQVAPNKLVLKLQEAPPTKHCSQNHETSITPLNQTGLIDEILFPRDKAGPVQFWYSLKASIRITSHQ
jgi:hypothetical protein